MAGIATQGGGSKRSAVDHEIPLVPFIDLLLCCVMFLLATAVWTHLSSLEANQQIPQPAGVFSKPIDREAFLEKVQEILS